ncbi:TPA: fimbrial protein [Providencia rettgeri]
MKIRHFLLLLFIITINTASAVPVNFSGRLIEGVPCVINNNRPINIDFGDDLVVALVPTKDGKTYIQDIDFEWECNGISSGTDVIFSFDGAPSDFDKDLLAINEQDDIALQLYQGSRSLKLNSDFTYTYRSDNDTPDLKASLVKNSSSSARVYAGAFTANATLTVAYQ